MAFAENLAALRRIKGLSQEELAAAIGVSRQTLSKYETGESLPDIERSRAIAEYFGVSLDDLVSFDTPVEGMAPPPRGKHLFGVVKVGERGQIVIPAEARRIFGLDPGTGLVVLGDEFQGLALIKEQSFLDLVSTIRTLEVNDGR